MQPYDPPRDIYPVRSCFASERLCASKLKTWSSYTLNVVFFCDMKAGGAAAEWCARHAPTGIFPRRAHRWNHFFREPRFCPCLLWAVPTVRPGKYTMGLHGVVCRVREQLFRTSFFVADSHGEKKRRKSAEQSARVILLRQTLPTHSRYQYARPRFVSWSHRRWLDTYWAVGAWTPKDFWVDLWAL